MSARKRNTIHLLIALACIIGAFSQANAQTPSPLANWQYAAGQVLESLEIAPPKWDITVGAGTTMLPRYEGAKKYKVWPSGIVDIRYYDIAFLSDGEGLGVNLLHGKGYRAGVALSYDLGRRQSADPRLAGLGSISAAPEAKAFGEYFLKAVVLTIDVRKGLGGHSGVIGDVGAYAPIPIIMDKLFVFLGPTVSFADDRYMTAYFGVTPAQSKTSRLPVYRATGGIKSAGGGATVVDLLGEHWLINFDGGYERLLRAALRSPITVARTQVTADLNIGYRF